MLSEIKGHKIREKRGSRSLQEIAAASGHAFSDVALLKWETNKMKPKTNNLKALLKALGCTYDDLAEPVDLTLS